MANAYARERRRGFSGGGRGVIFPSSSAEIPVDAGWLSQHTNNYIDKYTLYISQDGQTDRPGPDRAVVIVHRMTLILGSANKDVEMTRTGINGILYPHPFLGYGCSGEDPCWGLCMHNCVHR